MSETADPAAPQYPGDPRHPDHNAWLLALGKANFAAALVAGTCFDILRVFRNAASQDLYDDPVGSLINRLRALHKTSPNLSGLPQFLAALDPARESRNDLVHALPTAHGLHRRRGKDLSYVRDFNTVEALESVTAELEEVWRLGNALLYDDGGQAVRDWYAAGGT